MRLPACRPAAIGVLLVVCWAVLCWRSAAVAAAKEASATAKSTVAVMPFRDLTGAKPSIGEALRETVTTDLKELSSLRLVERAEIEKALGELKLQAQRTDLDAGSASKVGKFLGATMIVCGAYQEQSGQVRLTARFIKVETSEVVGAAKVDGKSSTLLRLQDKVTTELLRSAGLLAQAKHVVSRPRPELKSLRPLEFYGMALQASDDGQRLPLLQAAAAEDAGFSYAINDLKVLEDRIKRYQAAYAKASAAQLDELEQKVLQLLATKPEDAMLPISDLLHKLNTARRPYRVIALARSVLAIPTPPGLPSPNTWEMVANPLLQACDRIADWDCVLHEGEQLLTRFPNANTFAAIKSLMEKAIHTKREIEEGKQAAADAMAQLTDEQRWDICQIAAIYSRAHQIKEALRLYRACVATDETRGRSMLGHAIDVAANNGEFQAARQLIAELARRESPEVVQQQLSHTYLPGDGP